MARRTSTGSLILSGFLFCAAVAFGIGTRRGASTSPSRWTFQTKRSQSQYLTSVQATDGGPSPAVSGRIGEPLDDNGGTHVRVGTATIDRAGTYRVSADGYVSAAPNPQLLIGRVADHGPFIAAGFSIAGILLLGGVVSTVLTRRRRPTMPEMPAVSS